MNIFSFLQTRQWILVRRLILLGIVLFLGFRIYGGSLMARLQRPHPQRDIVVTRSEFRPDLPGERPAWFIGLKNQSSRFTYDKIELEATYTDSAGAVLEQDKLVIREKLDPGEEALVGSRDVRERAGAAQGSLKVMGAANVE